MTAFASKLVDRFGRDKAIKVLEGRLKFFTEIAEGKIGKIATLQFHYPTWYTDTTSDLKELREAVDVAAS